MSSDAPRPRESKRSVRLRRKTILVPRSRTEQPSRSRTRRTVIPWSAKAATEAWVITIGPGIVLLRTCSASTPGFNARLHASRNPAGCNTESASIVASVSHSHRAQPPCSPGGLRPHQGTAGGAQAPGLRSRGRPQPCRRYGVGHHQDGVLRTDRGIDKGQRGLEDRLFHVERPSPVSPASLDCFLRAPSSWSSIPERCSPVNRGCQPTAPQLECATSR